MYEILTGVADGVLVFHVVQNGTEEAALDLGAAVARHDKLATGPEFDALHAALIRAGKIPDDTPPLVLADVPAVVAGGVVTESTDAIAAAIGKGIAVALAELHIVAAP